MDAGVPRPDDMIDAPPPPPRLFDRLQQIPGFTCDESVPAFHSTYDHWHIFGHLHLSISDTSASVSSNHASSPASGHSRPIAAHSSASDPQWLSTARSSQDATTANASSSSVPSASLTPEPSDATFVEQPVVARVSYHAVREERAFQTAKSLIQTIDPEGDHILKPIDFRRLAPVPGDRSAVAVGIYHSLGYNALRDALDLGPAFYTVQKSENSEYRVVQKDNFRPKQQMSLQHFLDFAIGATHCLELLHHGKGMIHGEIRGDTFHYNPLDNKVRIISLGSGVRSFENGLTSTGWSALSKELGAKYKLLYLSPEQTGRMPAEPDSRTDIYSLGVLFWMLLAQRPVFEGSSPLEIVQGVLGKRIPNVSSIRMDIPDVIGQIIQKCTMKNVTDRYHSASGLRHDLVQIQKLLEGGDAAALKAYAIATQDVSSFFMLPTVMIGRKREKAELLKIIDKAAKHYQLKGKGAAAGRFSDGSALSTEALATDEGSSEGGNSSFEGTNGHTGSLTHTNSSDARQPRTNYHPSVMSETHTSNETMSSGQSAYAPRGARAWDRHHSISIETRSLLDSTLSGDQRHGVADSGSTSLSRQLGSAKFRRRGHCEVVLVEGAGGLGKSLLVSTILADARRRGYCATAKFDTARRTAFGPLLKLLSSLFKQVWGEPDTDTPFHQGLKQYIRPVWPMIHRVLGLPEFLLGSTDAAVSRSGSTATSSYNGNARMSTQVGIKRRGSSPGSSVTSALASSATVSSSASQDFLRAGSSTRSMRLMNIFLDILRVFTAHKFICFCLDDLHFADDESLELISQMINSRMNMVVIVTYRPAEMAPDKLQLVIQPPDLEDSSRGEGARVTRIPIAPLSEEDITEYCATLMCSPESDIISLALVIQSKTAGNPFLMREILSACHRQKCIWYDYRDNRWHFDLDRIFEHFRDEENYDVLGTSFVTRRLNELPNASRTLIAWASLIGNTFSFDLVRQLMLGEFDFEDDDPDACDFAKRHQGYTDAECISGLQAAVQAYIIIQSETDDRFRFAHDRYINAAAALKECNSTKMHFMIAQTLLKYYSVVPRDRESTAMHITESVDVIRQRVSHRRPFRELLVTCAQTATEGSARPTAAKYYKIAMQLLQDDAWDEGVDDVSYAETVQLHLRLAECHLFLGQHKAATEVLSRVFRNAKTAIDKAPAYVLQSRIFSEDGDSNAALLCLKSCLADLGVILDEHPTYEMCDEKFHFIKSRVGAGLSSRVELSESDKLALASIGAVLSETVSAAWWSDSLRFYHLALLMVEMHLERGEFPQSGIAFLFLGTISLARFNMTKFAVDMGNIALDLLHQSGDAFSLARGTTIYPIYLGHVHQTTAASLIQMEHSIEYAALAGDRQATILSYALSAEMKFFASENLVDLQAFCQFGCEEVPNWHHDTRAGSILLGIRQLCRALQGKTKIKVGEDVMSDDVHDASAYKLWLTNCLTHSNRSKLMYQSFEIVPLFLYGHYDRAVEVGEWCLQCLDMLWSSRNSRLVLFFHGLALTGQLLRKMQDPRSRSDSFVDQCAVVVGQLKGLIESIEAWTTISDTNYFVWLILLRAQVAELTEVHGEAVQHYEEALDHATEYHFVFEEALGNYLMAGFFLRRKARRSAHAALLEAVGLYRRLGATGIATAIEEEHILLLQGPTRHHWTSDVGVQTDFVADASTSQYRSGEADEGDDGTPMPRHSLAYGQGDRIGAWRGTMNMPREDGAGLPALDMIDLHAILVSSQVISSMLNVDELLKTMCDVILQTCGGSATLAAIVVQEESSEDWVVAASGDPEKGASAHNPGLALSGTSLIAGNVVLYCTRFLEALFVPDLTLDERFGNVSDAWLQRNPLGKAIIAIPICHANKPLLGVLYLEGVSGSFTDRNVTVLQLLVNQIGISYSNALAMKNVEKISAENRSMVDIQQKALKKAIQAESKAKSAEVEAKKHVKLAEEAAKAKSIFLANVSHELRTPLNGVIGNSELLRDSGLNKEQLEMADSIRVSADLLLTVINDILDFSKMEADKMKLYIIAFNPEEMVREVVRAVSYSNREKTSKKNVKIIQDIKLPSMLIFGDPIRLHQVLGNLINNSLKFTEDGSITIGARLDSDTQKKTTLTFWVRDTGIGIPPQQLAKLFQPFSQADASTARKYGGSGLGLSICKSLIEIMMNGKIQLESEENVGTTAWFTLSFDKAEPDVLAGDAQSQSPPPVDHRVDGHTGQDRIDSPDLYVDLSNMPKGDVRICVAEDNPINQKIAIQYVQRLGYTNVSAYENGLKALEGLRQKAEAGEPYHIVLMDVQMPVLDGYEATKQIRKDPLEAVRKVLVIAMTASAIQGDREKCLAAGMNDYLAKPVRSEVLRRKLDAYMTSPEKFTHHSDQAAARFAVKEDASNHDAVSGEDSKESAQSIPRKPLPPTPPEQGPSDPAGQQSTLSNTTQSPPLVDPTLEPVNQIDGVSTNSQDIPDRTVKSPTSVHSASQKRPPRKLTKNRSSTQDSIPRKATPQEMDLSQDKASDAEQTSGEKGSSDQASSASSRAKGLLQKKPPQRQGSLTDTTDGG